MDDHSGGQSADGKHLQTSVGEAGHKGGEDHKELNYRRHQEHSCHIAEAIDGHKSFWSRSYHQHQSGREVLARARAHAHDLRKNSRDERHLDDMNRPWVSEVVPGGGVAVSTS